MIWDFDKTLTPGYMEEPLFKHYDVDGTAFWSETNGMESFLRKDGLDLVSGDSIYLQHILTYVREGTFHQLSNDLLHQLGSQI